MGSGVLSDALRSVLERSAGADVRLAVREGRWASPTRGLARGYVQAGVVGLPEEFADDFLLFCTRNPGPCPLIEVVESGVSKFSAPGANLSSDLPAYSLYCDGQLVEQGHEVGWKYGKGIVWFVIGCSYSFEFLLEEAGIELKGMRQGRGNPLFITTKQCVPAGAFSGSLVVSMRPVPGDKVGLASHLSGKLPVAHGVPVHVGDPRALGIADLEKPDFGSPAQVDAGELPVFWACSVTPQAVAVEKKIPMMITQKPGHMFVTDLKVLSMLA